MAGRPIMLGPQFSTIKQQIFLWRTLMKSRLLVLTIAISSLTTPMLAAPGLSIIPGGIQGNDWVWQVDVTPDLVLAGGSTPLAVELGFRLTGSDLLSVTNINPSQWDTPNPGNFIFGWESPGSGTNGFPEGLQMNASTSEIFAAYGSVVFNTPGPKPFLQIVAKGPANGGATHSTIQWLGAYSGNGRISNGTTGFPPSQNFDIYAGTDTQFIPEPASAVLMGLGVMFAISLRAWRFRRALSA
jgi:hypothetical protein